MSTSDSTVEGYRNQIDSLVSALPLSPHIYRDAEPVLQNAAGPLLNLPKEALPQAIAALCSFIRREPSLKPGNEGSHKDNRPRQVVKTLLARWLRTPPPLEEPEVLTILQVVRAGDWFAYVVSVPVALRVVERYLESNSLTQCLRDELNTLESALIKPEYRPPGAPQQQLSKEKRALVGRIHTVLNGMQPQDGPLNTATVLPVDEPWAAAARKDIQSSPPALQKKCGEFLLHARSANGSKPSQKWLSTARTLISSLDPKAFKYFLISWLPLATTQRQMFSPESQDLLKGIVWAASTSPDPQIIALLGDLGEMCWKKIPGFGPTCKLVGNAVLWSLSASATPQAVAQLTRINSKLKHASARKLADKALNRAAENTGQTRDDLEELAVPAFDLVDGKTCRQLGDFTASIILTSTIDAELSFADSAGKIRKSIPASLKIEHASALQALKRTLKQIQTTLTSQRSRIESLLRAPDRAWPLQVWRARYVDHPLLGNLSRRLVWQFTTGSATTTALLVNDQFLSASGQPLSLPIDATVKLWHPCTDVPASVLAWRTFLDTHKIAQPFKQAHREVYLLTDAERTTHTYSNRFAAHIIRQHQFIALCAARGWRYRLQGGWDSGGGGIPTLDLPLFGFKAEFWVEQIVNQEAPDISASGVSLHLSTDQVRFYRHIPNAQTVPPLPLDQIPPQIFSEIMRDVDLFVGVCSVGMDPTWQNGGPNGRFQQYWQSVSFGDLSASALTRKAVLETLVPRFKIARVCSITDKFLRVQGTRRAYKIHLGSGNILMEPNDQYLCIVANQSERSQDNLYLPFEGDSLLSIIISKAFLLAADDKIKDPTILSQIGK